MSFRSWEGRQRSVGWSSEKASWRLLERGQGHVKRVSAIFGWGSKGWQRDLQEEPRVSMGAEALRSSAWWVWGEGRTRVQGQSCLAAHLSPLSSFDSLSSHPCLVFSLSAIISIIYHQNGKETSRLTFVPNFLPLYLELCEFSVSLTSFSATISCSLCFPESVYYIFPPLLSHCACLWGFPLLSETLSHSPQANVSNPMLCIKGNERTLGYPMNGGGVDFTSWIKIQFRVRK